MNGSYKWVNNNQLVCSTCSRLKFMTLMHISRECSGDPTFQILWGLYYIYAFGRNFYPKRLTFMFNFFQSQSSLAQLMAKYLAQVPCDRRDMKPQFSSYDHASQVPEQLYYQLPTFSSHLHLLLTTPVIQMTQFCISIGDAILLECTGAMVPLEASMP